MRRIPWVPIFIVLILSLVGVLVYWIFTPRLLRVSPPDGANAIPIGASLRITFSRPMRTEDLLEHLQIQPSIQGSSSWEGKTWVYTPAVPWPSGEQVEVILEAGAHADDWLGLPLRQGTQWTFVVTQARLAYLYPNDGPADIYVLNPYSGESQRLTNSPGGVDSFSVTHNGAAIYYSVRGSQGSSAVFRRAVNQEWVPAINDESQASSEYSEPILVLDCPRASCRDPVVSPNGEYLAYERVAFVGGTEPSYPQIWLLALDTEGNPKVTSEPTLVGPELHQTLGPNWSSQNMLVIYDTNQSAYLIYDPDRGILYQFANQTGQPGSWHPDGREFVAPEINFLGEDTAPDLDDLQPLANSQLMLFNLENSTTRNLTSEEDLEDTSPAFSPDGAYLAFARKSLHIDSWTPGRQLWLMRTGIWEAEALTNDELYNHFDFAWSPQGDVLAYVRFNQSVLSEPPELWIMDPFSRQATELLVGGYRPHWIP